LRHLRAIQVAARIRYRLSFPAINEAEAVPRRPVGGGWRPPLERPQSFFPPADFRFLNARETIPDQGGWSNASPDKLWVYNLHYFDDLSASCGPGHVEKQAALMLRWVAENPPRQGVGWEPYPVSLRIVNWIKWTLAGNTLPGDCELSLAVQARWLRRRLEWHLLGNHLLVNAKALVYAGLFFEGPEADEWLAEGLRVIASQLEEQVLPDGGHFELSPMYHALVLEDVLDLLNAAGHWVGAIPVATCEHWRNTAVRMLEWLAVMSHPDGEIAFFNDAALGIAGHLRTLRDYATRLDLDASSGTRPVRGRLLPDSGYARLAVGPAVLLADVGRVGPDYQPGHAHADTLSFELSLFGERIVVNSGTSCYGVGPQRQRERGTGAHSTVQIGDADSSEVWSGFRVARRARPLDRVVSREGETEILECAHDGYRRLRGRPIHRRRWRLRPDGLDVTDRIDPCPLSRTARYFLHPAIRWRRESSRVVRLGHEAWGREVQVAFGEDCTMEIEVAEWHPEFGISVPSACIVARFGGEQLDTRFDW
jgi:uncharacterized heparinase superfamily protein